MALSAEGLRRRAGMKLYAALGRGTWGRHRVARGPVSRLRRQRLARNALRSDDSGGDAVRGLAGLAFGRSGLARRVRFDDSGGDAVRGLAGLAFGRSGLARRVRFDDSGGDAVRGLAGLTFGRSGLARRVRFDDSGGDAVRRLAGPTFGLPALIRYVGHDNPRGASLALRHSPPHQSNRIARFSITLTRT